MKRIIVVLICVLASISSMYAQTQTAADALKPDNQTLRERYLLMKSKSQNYQEYKVIKEYILDGFWKLTMDSVTAKQAAIRNSQAEIKKLQGELNQSIENLKAKEASMADVVYDSTHISVLGIPFTKSVFATLAGVVILLLALAIAGIIYSMRIIRQNLTEKEELMKTLSAEYEDYKRKAMDKQTKLSRELQNERNKLQELGSL
jgi:Skp family chaperone for outer membrane proteins